ncbi:hypothetical protein [Pseudoxanthomonas koreensis]|uniref:hypothetical protein n=1 Tax=Pseudoxanthomonas koreensis TaxID=266061 RepID=UPI0035A5F959
MIAFAFHSSARVGIAAAAIALAGCSGAGAADTAADTAATPGQIDTLPLERGYYVRTDDTCATASGATTALLRREGLFWGGSFCRFAGIEQTGPTTFRVQQACGDHHGAPEPTPAEWVITDRTSFSLRDSEGWEHAARLCAQQDMPVHFRDTDIAELIR